MTTAVFPVISDWGFRFCRASWGEESSVQLAWWYTAPLVHALRANSLECWVDPVHCWLPLACYHGDPIWESIIVSWRGWGPPANPPREDVFTIIFKFFTQVFVVVVVEVGLQQFFFYYNTLWNSRAWGVDDIFLSLIKFSAFFILF